MRTAIVNEPIDPAAVLTGFTSKEDGACLLFLGVVRDHNEGRPVTGLDYEAYEGMAENTLATIASEASHRFGTTRIVVLHRVGSLSVGEISTAIAVATPHRGAAYDASRFIIEELKQRLPVWKREHYVDGDVRWVGEDRIEALNRTGSRPEEGTIPSDAGLHKGQGPTAGSEGKPRGSGEE